MDIAADTYNLLAAFFFTLHPEYSKNKFYIFGESYAGKYVPWLAYTILQNNTRSGNKINLSGIGVGDGLVAPYYQVPSYGDFLYSNNLINAVELGLGPSAFSIVHLFASSSICSKQPDAHCSAQLMLPLSRLRGCSTLGPTRRLKPLTMLC
jgi:carboxypeptidase C (cathepsin A)